MDSDYPYSIFKAFVRWEVIAHFVDIGWIVDNYYINLFFS
jgi:hypothetical protein